MNQLFKIKWWKWTGAFLVFFSLMVGLLTPLSPGIRKLSPQVGTAGDTLVLKVNTVNAHFLAKPNGLQAAISNPNEFLIKALTVKPTGNNQVEMDFIVPKEYSPLKGSVKLLDLELSSDYDGLLVLRQAFELKPNPNFLPHPTSATISKSIGSEKFKIKRLTPEWFSFPYREILYESLRNLFFHVAMWPVMLTLFLISVIYSILYLKTNKVEYDFIAVESVQVGLVFASIGIATGSLWARFTWGDWWPNDPKLNGTAIAILLYFAYIILRNSISEEQQRAKISAVYNIFAFPLMFVVIMILPRLTDSLHPGNGGNPGFNTYDLDSHLRIALYPAFLGWILIGLWITEIRYRIRKIENIIL